MRFVTSDLHLGHEKVIDFCDRPFKNIKEMDDEIINNINKVVSKKDLLYILGDFCFGNQEKINGHLSRINTKQVFLIRGNHDRIQNANNLNFASVSYYKKIKEKINNETERFILFHYPIYEWENCQHGSYHLHGHTHGAIIDKEKFVFKRFMNVGVDLNNFRPLSLEEIVDTLKDYHYGQRYHK